MRNVLDKSFLCSPGLSIEVGHHKMECIVKPRANLIECIDMPLVHVKIGIGGKFNSLLGASTPLAQGRIELLELAV